MGVQAGDVPAKESSTKLAWFSKRSFGSRIADLKLTLNSEQATFFASNPFPAVLDKSMTADCKLYLRLVATCASTAPLPLLLAVQQSYQHPPESFRKITSASADDK